MWLYCYYCFFAVSILWYYIVCLSSVLLSLVVTSVLIFVVVVVVVVVAVVVGVVSVYVFVFVVIAVIAVVVVVVVGGGGGGGGGDYMPYLWIILGFFLPKAASDVSRWPSTGCERYEQADGEDCITGFAQNSSHITVPWSNFACFHPFSVIMFPLSLILWCKLCIFNATKSLQAAATMGL